ncbi:DUF2913 family protein [Lactobacillus casei]|uniref:DUF2913 family protein n=1 Tax=Providencia rettgeri TaxID=587 RepID=UPI00141951E1|nr:DUF2913 family protein [Providencia rettgeri]NIG84211.1 DUF2913 family protein [Lacticaseibacillus casei]NIH07080.1 DUF2913 family protein [Providencia rettgeri]
MTKTSNSPITVEEKNRWLGKLAFASLVALKLAQWDGKAARNAQSENLFLLRWLQTALKQKRFHRCVVHDFEWLINLGQQRLMTSKLKSRLEYLWRSCCCDIASQSDLFRLTYATELLKDLGWDSVVLSDDRWQKLITKKPMLTGTPTFYVTQSALTAGFSDDGKQVNSVNFWVLGDKEQFSEVIKQHHLCGQFDENLPHYTLLLSR